MRSPSLGLEPAQPGNHLHDLNFRQLLVRLEVHRRGVKHRRDGRVWQLADIACLRPFGCRLLLHAAQCRIIRNCNAFQIGQRLRLVSNGCERRGDLWLWQRIDLRRVILLPMRRQMHDGKRLRPLRNCHRCNWLLQSSRREICMPLLTCRAAGGMHERSCHDRGAGDKTHHPLYGGVASTSTRMNNSHFPASKFG